MLQNIDNILDEAKQFEAHTREEIEQFRIKYLGKKGLLTDLFKNFKDVPVDQKKEVGQKINQLKQFITERVNELLLSVSDDVTSNNAVDLTLPGPPPSTGSTAPHIDCPESDH